MSISTNRRVFLIKFIQSTECFIVQDKELFHVIKNNIEEKGQIDFIKQSDSYIPKFKMCAKSLILTQFNWDTESYLYFKSLPYFKGVK